MPFHLFAVIISILFSYLAIILDPIVNPDGILYLVTAEKYLINGIAGASKVYEWPFYSIAIAIIHQISGCSLLWCAHLLNAILLAALVYCFILLVKEMGGNHQICLFAAILILINPSLNDYRQYIIRDFGYWVFCILALIYLIRLNNNRSFYNAVVWAACTMIAVLFRPEAVIFLFLLPLSALLTPSLPISKKIFSTIKLYTVPLFTVLVVFAAERLGSQGNLSSAKQLVFNKYHTFALELGTGFYEASERYRTLILNDYSSQYAEAALIAGLIVILIIKLFKTLNIYYSCLLIYGYFKKHYKPPETAVAPYFTMIVLNIIILMVFLVKEQFLQGRFLILLSLLLTVPIAFSINKLFISARNNNKRNIFITIFSVFSLVLLIDSFVSFGYSKRYIMDSVDWLKHNTPKNVRVFSNLTQIAYLSDRKYTWNDIFHNNNFYKNKNKTPDSSYSYWAIYVKKKNKDLNAFLDSSSQHLQQVADFSNSRGDRVVIFKPKYDRDKDGLAH